MRGVSRRSRWYERLLPQARPGWGAVATAAGLFLVSGATYLVIALLGGTAGGWLERRLAR